MKAMVLREKGAPFSYEDVPDPTPGEGEAVARVIACGSGLTIHHARAGRVDIDYPMIIGHEVVGEIVETGAGVSNVKAGDVVTFHCYLTCGHCRWCRVNREPLCDNMAGFVGRHLDGGYAEYINLPAQNYVHLPEGLDYKAYPAEAAVICDAIVTPYKVVRRARIEPMETVAVIGAGGGVGIHMVMLARWANARVIAVDVSEQKLAQCKELGAEATINASKDNLTEALLELTGGLGVDVAIDFVSQDTTLEAAAEALDKGGRLVTLGGTGQTFQTASREMVQKELELMGSRYASKQELKESLDLVARGDVWPVVTETYSFNVDEVEKVHERLEVAAVTGRAVVVMD